MWSGPSSHAEEPVGVGPSPVAWHTRDFFSSCAGNCDISLYGGGLVTSPALQIFITDPAPPWHWRYGNAGIIAGAFSRRLVTLWGGLEIGPEVGVARHFGDMHANEVWIAMRFRWTEFPWNDYVKTTVGFADGPNYATAIDAAERLQSKGRGSHILNFASPEITFALPDKPNWELLVEFHHRSGIFGLLNGVSAASQFLAVGLRHQF